MVVQLPSALTQELKHGIAQYWYCWLFVVVQPVPMKYQITGCRKRGIFDLASAGSRGSGLPAQVLPHVLTHDARALPPGRHAW